MTNSKPRRWTVRFSLASVLILLTLASIWFAYLAGGPYRLAISRVEFHQVGDFPDFTSAEIIDAAVSRPEVAQSETIKGHSNPNEWLRQHLTVRPIGKSSLVEVSIRGTTRYPEDFATILDGFLATLADQTNQTNGNHKTKRLEDYTSPTVHSQPGLRKGFWDAMELIRTR